VPIETFRSKRLADLWRTGRSAKIDARLYVRVLRRLEVIDTVERVEEINLTGFNFHRLQGFHPPRFTVHVNGPWCITFEFDDGDAFEIDFEQYH
jgi:proteic killer suppression protein